jgi:mRNA-degrading endonuclease RelE of RelBE toxin-antitoxin system
MAPYRIVYEIDDVAATLAILRIWHGARGNLELPA